MKTALFFQSSCKPLRKRLCSHLPLYIMAFPGLLYLFINNYMPLPGLQLAFKKFKYSEGIWGSHFNGLKNFRFLFRSNDAAIILRNTLGYNVLFIVLGTVLAIAVAVLLNEVSQRWMKQTYQTLILIPHLLSYVIVSYIVFALLGQDSGLINNAIRVPLGLERISWYTEAKYWPAILVAVNLWKVFGYNTIFYYASIIGFDKAYYEAAVVDGASSWKQIRHITLPLLKPVVVTLTLLSIGKIFYSDFGLFYQVPMDSGILYDATNTIDTYVYRGLLKNNDIGRASAAGFLQSALGFALVLSTNLIVRRIDKEYALF